MKLLPLSGAISCSMPKLWAYKGTVSAFRMCPTTPSLSPKHSAWVKRFGDVASNVCSPHQHPLLGPHQSRGCGKLFPPNRAGTTAGSYSFDPDQAGIDRHQFFSMQALFSVVTERNLRVSMRLMNKSTTHSKCQMTRPSKDGIQACPRERSWINCPQYTASQL
jgi:hypothetical protein